MSISGSLEDVSVADVMQFIHLGRRTGTLVLRRDDERGMIGFHRGKLVSAGSPGTPRLGELLLRGDLVSGEELEEAVRLQETEPERRTLGQILLAREAIDLEALRRVVAQQIEQTISELVGWDRGSFEFVVDDQRPVDDIALYPGDVLPDADINTQMVLLEAARIFDERNRGSAGAADDTHPSGPAFAADAAADAATGAGEGAAAVSTLAEPEAAWSEAEEIGVHRLQIVSSDAALVAALDQALPPGFAAVEPVGLRAAGKAFPGHETPIVILDLRREGVSVEELGRIRRTRPGTPLVALIGPGAHLGPVYEAGALAALPPEVEAVVACVENLARNRRRSAPGPGFAGAGPAAADGQTGVERLRRVFGDLRSGLISATVALNLMHIISESVERAILFLVRRDALTALGAFGTGAGGRSLAELTRGLTLPLAEENVLTRSYAEAKVVTAEFDRAELPPKFTAAVERPANGKVVVFPVLGSQRVISVIYADNGENESPIEDIDILELATAQVGMAFENELLRRQISQQT
ncbi:MAG TPA: DUF4388 domain-containing protein [Thermoanaerobaculia bacterium]|nr:DUF4388 domain-containing protein [Thermoanaerobaculia bacterium]